MPSSHDHQNYDNNEAADIIRSSFPEIASRVPKSNDEYKKSKVYKLDNSKAKKEMGIDCKSSRLMSC